MNEEQFLRLQAEVDHIARAHFGDLRDGELGWNQATWCQGTPTGGTVAYETASDWVLEIYRGKGPEVANVCGTYACFAGNVAHREGDTFAVVKTDNPVPEVRGWMCVSSDGVLWDIRDRAAQLLGLDDDEAETLFDGNNDYEQIVEHAVRIADAHGFSLVVP